MLDEHGEAIFATTDELAERVRKIGGTTLRSISQISKLQSIATTTRTSSIQRHAARTDDRQQDGRGGDAQGAQDLRRPRRRRQREPAENFIDATERRTCSCSRRRGTPIAAGTDLNLGSAPSTIAVNDRRG